MTHTHTTLTLHLSQVARFGTAVAPMSRYPPTADGRPSQHGCHPAARYCHSASRLPHCETDPSRSLPSPRVVQLPGLCGTRPSMSPRASLNGNCHLRSAVPPLHRPPSSRPPSTPAHKHSPREPGCGRRLTDAGVGVIPWTCVRDVFLPLCVGPLRGAVTVSHACDVYGTCVFRRPPSRLASWWRRLLFESALYTSTNRKDYTGESFSGWP